MSVMEVPRGDPLKAIIRFRTGNTLLICSSFDDFSSFSGATRRIFRLPECVFRSKCRLPTFAFAAKIVVEN